MMNNTTETIDAKFVLQRGDFKLDVAFTVPIKGVTAIFGPSGSGKSTLLRILAGLEPCEQGHLNVGGRDWQRSSWALPPHRRDIGYVFQEASLFTHLSVKHNLEYGFKRVPKSQRLIHFDETVELLGVEPLLSRNTTSLSGGERQRVAIARALLTSPQLVLMDEPLAALDENSKAEILPFLERLHDTLKIPLFYVSHSANEVAQLADYLLLMHEGKIQSQGPLSDTLSDISSSQAKREDAFSMLNCVVIQPDSAYHLSVLKSGDEFIHIPKINAKVNQSIRLRIQARDISLCLDKPQHSSILNVLPATILDLSPPTKKGQCMVRLEVTGQILIARLSEYSCVRLKLSPGLSLFAQIKAMALFS